MEVNMALENKLGINDSAELAREEEKKIIEKYVEMNVAHPFREGKHSIGQMIIKSKYQAKLKIKELDIFLFQILLIILNSMIKWKQDKNKSLRGVCIWREMKFSFM